MKRSLKTFRKSLQARSTAPVLLAPLAQMGYNGASVAFYKSPYALINMVQQSNPFWEFPDQTGDTGPWPPTDAEGWPMCDFRFAPKQFSGTSGPETALCRCRGWFDSMDFPFSDNAYLSMTDKVYDAGTNITTFKINTLPGYTPGSNLVPRFAGTRRTGGSTGTTNTGLTELEMAVPGFQLDDIVSQRWTPEWITYTQRFKSIRIMDFQQFNNGGTPSTWATAPNRETKKIGGPSIQDCCDLCNIAGIDLWCQSPWGFSDSDVAAFATVLDETLNDDRIVRIGMDNETWNSAFNQFHQIVQQTAIEVKGFVGDEGPRNFQASRSGGVLTMVTNSPHGWTTGQPLYVLGGRNGDGSLRWAPDGTYIVTVIDANTASFVDGGEDAVSLNIGSSCRCTYDTSTSLTPDNGADGVLDIYGLQRRWCIRRLVQISDVIRATVGDAKMGTKFHMVWEDMMVSQELDVLCSYVAANFNARPITDYFVAFAGAPYFFGNYNQVSGATEEQVLDGLINGPEGCYVARSNYLFEWRAIMALKWGMHNLWYEGGPDTKYYGDDATNEDLVIRCAVQFNPGIKAPILQMIKDWQLTGGSAAQWYTGGFLQPTDNNRDSVWGIARGPDDLTAPKLEAIVESMETQATITRNIVGTPDPLDGRGRYGVYSPFTGAFPRLDYNGGNPATQYLLYDPVGGNRDVKVTLNVDTIGHPFRIIVNGVNCGDFTPTATGSKSFSTTAAFNQKFNYLILIALDNQNNAQQCTSLLIT